MGYFMRKKITYQTLIGVFAITTSTFMVGCNSGTSSNSNGNNTNTQTIYVPEESQVRTPVSAKTIFSKNATANGLQKASLTSTSNSCIQLTTQNNGQNYFESYTSSPWWSSAYVTVGITNTCSTPQAFSPQIIFNNAQLNGANIPTSISPSASVIGSPWSPVTYSGGGTSNPSLTITSPTCTGSGCSWAQLAPGAQITITTNFGLGESINSFTIGSVEIAGATPPPPATTGTLALNLSASGLSSVCSGATNCNFQVNVVSQSNQVVATEYLNANTSSTANYNIINLAPGNYSVNVVANSIPSVASGTITSNVSPASTNVTAGATTTSNVSFGFTSNPINQVTLDLNTANIPAQFANNTVYAQILNSAGATVVTGIQFTKSALTQTISSSALVSGQTYTLQIQGLADPKSGVYYSPIIESFVVNGSSTTVNSNAYQIVPSNKLYTVNLAVQNPQAGQTIAYGSDTNYYSYAIDSVSSGSYTFLSNDTITLTPSAVAGYSSSLSPTNTLTSANAGQTVTLVNTQATSTLQYCVDSLCQAQLTTLGVAANVGETNTQTIFVQNLGSVAATLPTTASYTTAVNGLSVTPGTCGFSLAPGAICSLNVTYAPSSATAKSSTTMIYDSAPLLINYGTTNNTSKIMGEYWCGFSNDYCGQSAGNDVNAAATHVIMAFANTNQNGSIAVDPVFPTSLVQSWQNSGKVVTLSVGGANVSWTTVFANTNTFALSVQQAVAQYNLNGVDLDIENGTATPQQVADAINLLRQYLGESAVITIAPQNVGVAQNVPSVPSATASNAVGAWNFFVPVLQNSLNSISLVYQQDYNNGCGYTNPATTEFFECNYASWANLANASTVTGGSQIAGFVGVPVSKLIVGTIASSSAGVASYYGGMAPLQGFYTAMPTSYGITPSGFMFWDSNWDSLNNYTISNGIASMMNM
ncbi:MAG: hypothetical protein E6Q33_10375 [Neisseriales bacterium]|nr:MAG: hypothetical protein E6Q33_10375 [Neisseriales bacterium]